MSTLDEDMTTAHHFALGAMHVAGKHSFSESEHESRYTLATGFAYFYTRDGHMALGIDGAWDAYAEEIKRVSEVECFHCDGAGKLSVWDDEEGKFIARYDDEECAYCDGRGRVSREDDRRNRLDEAQRIAERSHP